VVLQETANMNIFFLSLNPEECAKMYCDQHVNKILIEIVQMLYTAWHFLGSESTEWSNTAPWKKDHSQRGFKVAHPNHPMCKWVRASRENYIFTTKIGMCLALEYNFRYQKVHSCSKHVLWLFKNVPVFPNVEYTPPPQCMPEQYKRIDPVEGYKEYYKSKTFARWTKRIKPLFM